MKVRLPECDLAFSLRGVEREFDDFMENNCLGFKGS